MVLLLPTHGEEWDGAEGSWDNGTFSQRTSTLGRDSSHSRVTLSFSVATTSFSGRLNFTGSSGEAGEGDERQVPEVPWAGVRGLS